MKLDDRIDAYVRRAERWTAGGPSARTEVRRELEAHLREADEAGRLDEALDRLGSPREAARTFGAGRTPQPAPRWRRVLGAVVDYAQIVGPLWAIEAITRWRAWPERSATCVGFSCEASSSFLPFAFTFFAAFFWFAVVLTLLEWRYGKTPGKALFGLRAISEDGTALGIGQAILRRLPLVFSGPLQIVDWAFALRGPKHQRAFEVIARTQVVADR